MTAALARDDLPRTAGNEDTSLLKLIALFFMVIDHVGVTLLPQYREMRVLGRIAFPLYMWCVVVGVSYTRNVFKYGLRLLVIGIIAQPCYMWGLNHSWDELNVFATLFLGMTGAAGMREKKYGSHIWAPILAMAMALTFDMDYGWKGVLLILLLYAARNSRGGIAAVMIAYCLYWGQGTYSLTQVFGVTLPRSIPYMANSSAFIAALNHIQFFAILALPLMLIRTRSGLRLPKWAGYAAYPGHLLILAFILHYDEIAAAVARLF